MSDPEAPIHAEGEAAGEEQTRTPAPEVTAAPSADSSAAATAGVGMEGETPASAPAEVAEAANGAQASSTTETAQTEASGETPTSEQIPSADSAAEAEAEAETETEVPPSTAIPTQPSAEEQQEANEGEKTETEAAGELTETPAAEAASAADEQPAAPAVESVTDNSVEPATATLDPTLPDSTYSSVASPHSPPLDPSSSSSLPPSSSPSFGRSPSLALLADRRIARLQDPSRQGTSSPFQRATRLKRRQGEVQEEEEKEEEEEAETLPADKDLSAPLSLCHCCESSVVTLHCSACISDRCTECDREMHLRPRSFRQHHRVAVSASENVTVQKAAIEAETAAAMQGEGATPLSPIFQAPSSEQLYDATPIVSPPLDSMTYDTERRAELERANIVQVESRAELESRSVSSEQPPEEQEQLSPPQLAEDNSPQEEQTSPAEEEEKKEEGEEKKQEEGERAEEKSAEDQKTGEEAKPTETTEEQKTDEQADSTPATEEAASAAEQASSTLSSTTDFASPSASATSPAPAPVAADVSSPKSPSSQSQSKRSSTGSTAATPSSKSSSKKSPSAAVPSPSLKPLSKTPSKTNTTTTKAESKPTPATATTKTPPATSTPSKTPSKAPSKAPTAAAAVASPAPSPTRTTSKIVRSSPSAQQTSKPASSSSTADAPPSSSPVRASRRTPLRSSSKPAAKTNPASTPTASTKSKRIPHLDTTDLADTKPIQILQEEKQEVKPLPPKQEEVEEEEESEEEEEEDTEVRYLGTSPTILSSLFDVLLQDPLETLDAANEGGVGHAPMLEGLMLPTTVLFRGTKAAAVYYTDPAGFVRFHAWQSIKGFGKGVERKGRSKKRREGEASPTRATTTAHSSLLLRSFSPLRASESPSRSGGSPPRPRRLVDNAMDQLSVLRMFTPQLQEDLQGRFLKKHSFQVREDYKKQLEERRAAFIAEFGAGPDALWADPLGNGDAPWVHAKEFVWNKKGLVNIEAWKADQLAKEKRRQRALWEMEQLERKREEEEERRAAIEQEKLCVALLVYTAPTHRKTARKPLPPPVAVTLGQVRMMFRAAVLAPEESIPSGWRVPSGYDFTLQKLEFSPGPNHTVYRVVYDEAVSATAVSVWKCTNIYRPTAEGEAMASAAVAAAVGGQGAGTQQQPKQKSSAQSPSVISGSVPLSLSGFTPSECVYTYKGPLEVLRYTIEEPVLGSSGMTRSFNRIMLNLLRRITQEGQMGRPTFLQAYFQQGVVLRTRTGRRAGIDTTPASVSGGSADSVSLARAGAAPRPLDPRAKPWYFLYADSLEISRGARLLAQADGEGAQRSRRPSQAEMPKRAVHVLSAPHLHSGHLLDVASHQQQQQVNVPASPSASGTAPSFTTPVRGSPSHQAMLSPSQFSSSSSPSSYPHDPETGEVFLSGIHRYTPLQLNTPSTQSKGTCAKCRCRIIPPSRSHIVMLRTMLLKWVPNQCFEYPEQMFSEVIGVDADPTRANWHRTTIIACSECLAEVRGLKTIPTRTQLAPWLATLAVSKEQMAPPEEEEEAKGAPRRTQTQGRSVVLPVLSATAAEGNKELTSTSVASSSALPSLLPYLSRAPLLHSSGHGHSSQLVPPVAYIARRNVSMLERQGVVGLQGGLALHPALENQANQGGATSAALHPSVWKDEGAANSALRSATLIKANHGAPVTSPAKPTTSMRPSVSAPHLHASPASSQRSASGVVSPPPRLGRPRVTSHSQLAATYAIDPSVTPSTYMRFSKMPNSSKKKKEQKTPQVQKSASMRNLSPLKEKSHVLSTPPRTDPGHRESFSYSPATSPVGAGLVASKSSIAGGAGTAPSVPHRPLETTVILMKSPSHATAAASPVGASTLTRNASASVAANGLPALSHPSPLSTPPSREAKDEGSPSNSSSKVSSVAPSPVAAPLEAAKTVTEESTPKQAVDAPPPALAPPVPAAVVPSTSSSSPSTSSLAVPYSAASYNYDDFFDADDQRAFDQATSDIETSAREDAEAYGLGWGAQPQQPTQYTQQTYAHAYEQQQQVPYQQEQYQQEQYQQEQYQQEQYPQQAYSEEQWAMYQQQTDAYGNQSYQSDAAAPSVDYSTVAFDASAAASDLPPTSSSGDLPWEAASAAVPTGEATSSEAAAVTSSESEPVSNDSASTTEPVTES